MGTKNRQRRAAKVRRRAKDRAAWVDNRQTRQAFDPPPSSREQVCGLLASAVAAFRGGDRARAAEAILQLSACDDHIVDRESEGALVRVVSQLWGSGWQPAEVIRHARRTEARAGRLVATAVAADHAVRAASTLSEPWAAQVRALGLPDVDGAQGWMTAFAAGEQAERALLLSTVVTALAVLGGLGPLPTVIPPPGAGGRPEWASTPPSVDDPILARVRALLAQAESTTFPAEADAFTAKAQALMARHAIDAALVWSQQTANERPITARLAIDDPYADIKSLLLQRVAHHSRCQALSHRDYGLESVIGFAGDVAATEALFTSLLVQSQAALQVEAAAAQPGARPRSRAFRSSFLFSFTQRIDERLAEVNAFVEQAAAAEQGPSLLPALVARHDAVEAAVNEVFGAVTSSVVRGGRDIDGWMSGRMAANRAQLGRGDLAEPRRALEQ
jgi:hypothetical protein